MLQDEVRKKLQDIVQGIIIEADGDTCTTIRNLLCASFSTSKEVKKNFESQLLVKEEQAKVLKEYASQKGIWLQSSPDERSFLAAGGEARVYYYQDGRHVLKVNDAGYYATWLEYFNSLVLHNLFFPGTGYSFVGFLMKNNILHAVVKQPFIKADKTVDLENIESFLIENGFQRLRRFDYFNKEYGIILEDMHDENVLLNSEALFFIDTVFYTVQIGSNP